MTSLLSRKTATANLGRSLLEEQYSGYSTGFGAFVDLDVVAAPTSIVVAERGVMLVLLPLPDPCSALALS